MKSLSISTATAAVAISLASSAQANEQQAYIAPELDTMLFAASPAASVSVETSVIASETSAPMTIEPVTEEQVAPIDAQETNAPLTSEATAPQTLLLDDAFALDAPSGLLTLPASRGSLDADAPFYSASLNDANVVTTMSLSPHYGDIDAFWGDIVAFYGDIDAFWGDISPFYGDIDAFWGDISPFYGDIDAFWGDIVAFDQVNLASIGQFWEVNSALISNTDALWANSDDTVLWPTMQTQVVGELQTLVNNAVSEFGSAGFTQAEANVIFARHGINLHDPATLQNFTASERAAFFLDWHDTVNTYTGIDHVDHWMAAINWTPSITQIQGEGSGSLIGIIDGSFASDAMLGDNVVWSGGGTTSVNGHGVGVASLIAGAHDGQGVMGIAPGAKIATYNPFDADHSASWASVSEGISSLLFDAYVRNGNETGYVSIINLSLGESGWTFAQGMADILALQGVAAWHHETMYVLAAGNDGISQTADINYDHARDANFIIVGSVDPNGEISNFSNRPGSACLLDNGVCHSGNELYNRFIVAPGSMMLVSDGNGGVVRRSGTSFAAPLVSGAIALLHDRWGWLVRHPEETADIIFRTAQDLGAPGPDEVYGWGLLDVVASQSPLDFNNLRFTLYEQNRGRNYTETNHTAASLLASGIPSSWETNNAYLTGFEDIGGTFRDFAIPLSSLQYGQTTSALGHGSQRMQDFVGDRFARWMLSQGADKDGNGKLGLSQIRSNHNETQGQWSLRYDAIAPQTTDDGAIRPVHNAATLTNPTGTVSFTLGHGEGALALNGGQFGLMTDHDTNFGGVNPVLGFASGEMFAGATYKPATNTEVSFGFSQENQDADDLVGVSDIERQIQRRLGAREATAFTVGVEQKITDNLTFNAQYTRLNEVDALLGAQTGRDGLLGEGSKTDAMSVSANMDFGDGFSFDLSVTGGATEVDSGQLLASNGRALSTAGQFSVNKTGLMTSRDVLRVSVGQPLTVESGELELRSNQVIDRQTGEIGMVSQFIGIETKRRYTGQIAYATPVTKTSELGVVGRYISAGELGQDESFMIGANFGLRF